jgi:predicted 2-oxoglutarate/Fe(II)-dependent dioxygenase YbiX
MWDIKTLNKEELIEIKKLVNSALISNKNDLIESSYTLGYTVNCILLPIDKNKKLASILNFKTNSSINDIISLHYIKYVEGSSMKRHLDTNLVKHNYPNNGITTIFLLEMCEEGGDFLLNDINTNFNKPGTYISFNGNTTPHEVTEIKKGVREVVVLWYYPSSTIKKTII